MILDVIKCEITPPVLQTGDLWLAAVLACGLAGMMRTPYRRFLAYDLAGSALWAGSALFLGIIFRSSVQRGLDLLGAYLRYGVAFVLLAFASFIGWRLYQRRRLLQRMLRVPRVSVEELLSWDREPLILDVRSPEERVSDPIPHSVMVDYDVTLDALPQARLSAISWCIARARGKFRQRWSQSVCVPTARRGPSR